MSLQIATAMAGQTNTTVRSSDTEATRVVDCHFDALYFKADGWPAGMTRHRLQNGLRLEEDGGRYEPEGLNRRRRISYSPLLFDDD